jgi:hypothetical protein
VRFDRPVAGVPGAELCARMGAVSGNNDYISGKRIGSLHGRKAGIKVV